MAAIKLGSSEIERQLRSIRRRRNLLTVQQALYLWGGLAVLASALLVLVALRVQAPVFSFAFWAAAGTVALGLAAAGHHLWRRWLSAGAAAHWTDRNGNLDDRLATLVAHNARPQPTRLASLVVNQLYTLRHRWQPKVLVPRRVPRSVYFFLASLFALLMTAFIERPPAEPRVFRGARIGDPNASSRSLATAPGLPGDSAHLGDAPAAATGEPAAGGEAFDEWQTAKARGSRRGAHHDAAPHRGHGTAPGEIGRDNRTTSELFDDDRIRSDASGRDALSRRVQEMIRQALGAKTEAGQDVHERSPAGRGGERTAQRGRDTGQRKRTHAENDAARSAGAGAEAGRDRSDRERLARQSSSPKEGEGEGTLRGGQRASGGAGGKRAPGGLFGSDSPLAQSREALKTFQLSLSLLAQGARTTMEPQKRERGDVPDLGFATALPSEVRLSTHDKADDALLRTDIPAEHEGIVRRIFSHPE
jgi:hypothetical protein